MAVKASSPSAAEWPECTPSGGWAGVRTPPRRSQADVQRIAWIEGAEGTWWRPLLRSQGDLDLQLVQSAPSAELDRWLDRILDAPTLDALFAD